MQPRNERNRAGGLLIEIAASFIAAKEMDRMLFYGCPTRLPKALPRLALAAALAAPLLPLAATPSAAQVAPYRYLLGPQDRLMIRVHSLRRNTGEAMAWTPLNGEFTVGADGTLSMPIIGAIRAEGQTVTKLAERIGSALKESANLAETPSASVEILRHRSFYILGAVQQPGKFEFQPGLTVLQALSTAQGLVRAADLSGLEREMIASSGELRTLEAEKIALEATMARLAAEIAESETMGPVPALAHLASDPRVATAIAEETLRFKARRAALQGELDAIEQSKVLLQRELASLDEKGKSLDRQIEANKRELRLVSDLVSRGLSVSPRQLAAENTQVTVESSRLDVQVAALRAHQALARANRDVVDLRARYRKEALDTSATTRALLAQNAEKTETARRLLRNAESRAPGSGADVEEIVPRFRLTRIEATGRTTRMVTDAEMLEPGDVVEVLLPLMPAGTRGRAAALTR
jgi:protein involved in polysaccharide export with SLBB domain